MKLSVIALAAALSAGLSANAFAGAEIITSDTWQPGLSASDNGYVGLRHVPGQPVDRATIEVRHSNVWQPGFRASDNGSHVAVVPRALDDMALAAGDEPGAEVIERRSTWAPGYTLGTSGFYIKK